MHPRLHPILPMTLPEQSYLAAGRVTVTVTVTPRPESRVWRTEVTVQACLAL